MTRVFVDTNVLVYALGEQHRYREPCRRIVRLLATGELDGESSVEVIQELVHVRERRGKGRAETLQRAGECFELFGTIHAFEPRDLERALTLMDAIHSLPVRDAVHAATAINHGIGTILSADRDFDAVSGLARIDPVHEDAVLTLAGRSTAPPEGS